MSIAKGRLLLLAAGASLPIAGCGVGVDRTVFYTTTNLGVNLDRTPPTAEVSFSRREGVVQPAFEGGRHLPVAASMTMETGFLGSLAPTSVGQVFAGGAAAQILTAPSTTQAELADPNHGTLCLDAPPQHREQPALGTTSEVRSFVFGTDSSLGLVVAWADPTSPVPDSVRLGYRRQEMAIAPVQGRTETCQPGAGPSGAGTYRVGMPSFLATIRSDSSAGAAQQGGVAVGQTFATGLAARQLANEQGVRGAFQQAVVRDVRAATNTAPFSADAASQCITAWLGEGDQMKQDRADKVSTWLRAEGITATLGQWNRGQGTAGQRAKFIRDHNANAAPADRISCAALGI
jgi:hypothetical protein